MEDIAPGRLVLPALPMLGRFLIVVASGGGDPPGAVDRPARSPDALTSGQALRLVP